jgi:hypothetical protein
MTTLTEKRLGNALLSSSATTTIYTVPASTTAIAKIIWIANTNTSSDSTIELWHVTSGGSTASTNYLVRNLNIPMQDFTQINSYLILTSGESFIGKTNTNSSTVISVYGAELT